MKQRGIPVAAVVVVVCATRPQLHLHGGMIDAEFLFQRLRHLVQEDVVVVDPRSDHMRRQGDFG